MPGENILIVDDEALICASFERELSAKGYLVDTALNGAAALEAVTKKKYDLALIDKNMPGMDGIETCRAIKKISPETVLIFMTGFFDKENILKEKQFVDAGGRTFHLYKPFAAGEVQSVIQKALSDRGTV